MPADEAVCARHVRLCGTPRTVAHQAPLSMELSRQAHGSGLPLPPPGDLPDPGIKAEPPTSPALAGGFFTTESAGKPIININIGNFYLWDRICINHLS